MSSKIFLLFYLLDFLSICCTVYRNLVSANSLYRNLFKLGVGVMQLIIYLMNSNDFRPHKLACVCIVRKCLLQAF